MVRAKDDEIFRSKMTQPPERPKSYSINLHQKLKQPKSVGQNLNGFTDFKKQKTNYWKNRCTRIEWETLFSVVNCVHLS